MGNSTINKNDDLPMLNVTIVLRVWGEDKPMRTFREMTDSTSGGSEGGVMSLGSGDKDVRGASTLSSETSFKMAIIFFFPYTCSQENICHHNYNKGL
jgi:hypothetical protein